MWCVCVCVCVCMVRLCVFVRFTVRELLQFSCMGACVCESVKAIESNELTPA